MDDIDVVLFDAAGTLLFPDPDVIEVYQEVGARRGCSLTREVVKQRFQAAFRESFAGRVSESDETTERQSWAHVVARVFRELPRTDAILDELWIHFENPRHWKLFDDAMPCLEALKERRVQIGIASNFDRRIERICQYHFPTGSIDALFYSTEIGYRKPDRRFFQAVQSTLKTDASRLLMVGDDEVNDCRGPRRAGWHSLWLDRKANSPQTESIGSLTELIPRFESRRD